MIVLIVVIALVLAVLAAFGYQYYKGQPLSAEDAAIDGDLISEATPTQDRPLPEVQEASSDLSSEAFNRTAVVQGPAAVPLRTAPGNQGFAIAQINPGTALTTFEQSGDSWRVRLADGTTGYLPAASIRLSDAPAMASSTADQLLPPDESQAQATAPAAPAAAQPRTQTADVRPAPRREPRPRGPRINRRNSEAMIAFCQGAGRGTSQCRTFERRLRN